jgi:RNA polymerase sigma-70 factor (ECF subfamily)
VFDRLDAATADPSSRRFKKFAAYAAGVDADVAALVTRALGGGPARAQLFEVATAGRTTNDGSLDAVLNDLAARAAAGDESATELILELVHRLRLSRSAIAPIVSDPTMAEDVAQSTLVTVERKIGSYEGRAKFRTWLFTVARNEALMAVRPRKSDAEPVAEPPAAAARFSSIIAFRVSMETLVDGLPEPYRETLKLQVFENLDYDAIAERLGVPIGTVRSRLAKARQLLWDAMKAERERQTI